MMNFELGLLIKTSILLAGTACLAFAAGKASSSVRHMIWTAGLLSTLVLPFVSMALPELAVPLRPDSGKTVAWMSMAVAAAESAGPAAARPVGSHSNEGRSTGLPGKYWVLLAWSIGAAFVVFRFVIGI